MVTIENIFISGHIWFIKMVVSKEIRKKIIEAITEIGENIATIRNIEQKVNIERHTLSKYLFIMRRIGYIDFVTVGRAKVWHINKAPLISIFNSLPENRSFSEKLLSDLLVEIQIGIILIDTQFRILFMNNMAERDFGDLVGKLFYEEILGHKNPMKLQKIMRIIDNKSEREKFVIEGRSENYLRIKAKKLINPNNDISIILIIEDITHGKATIHWLKIIQKLFSSTLDKMDKAIILTNKEDIIIEVNHLALVKTGYTDKKNLLGLDIKELVSGNFETLSENPEETGKEKYFKGQIKTRKGDLFSTDIMYDVVKNAKKILGKLYIFS